MLKLQLTLDIKSILGLANLDKFDTNNLLITLSVIPLIDAHYSLKVIGYCSYVLSYMYFNF